MTVVTPTRLRPLGDRVVVIPAAREEQTQSGLYLPDTAGEKPMEGTVIAVGPGALDYDGQRVPMNVTPGDAILFAKFAGTEFRVDGQEVLIISQKDILAVNSGAE